MSGPMTMHLNGWRKSHLKLELLIGASAMVALLAIALIGLEIFRYG